jgi:hypothetical protein
MCNSDFIFNASPRQRPALAAARLFRQTGRKPESRETLNANSPLLDCHLA